VQLLKKLLGQKTISRGIVAISFLEQGIAIAIADFTEPNSIKLRHCEFIPSSELQQQLEKIVKEHQLTEFDCHLLLTAKDYRIINIEAPVVPDNEMKEAIRWKLNDLIDLPADQAEIDFFSMPPAKHTSAAPMLNAIASSSEILKKLLEPCYAAELNIKVIDIQETALRNLAVLLPENERGIALLHLQKNSGMIIIQKAGVIYLSRKLNTGFEQIELSDIDSVAEENQSTDQLNNLTLEIQRSLDYVESFYGLPPISSLAVIPLEKNTQKLLDFLNGNHGITARIMDISATMELNFLLNDTTQSLCSPVIGATLRYQVDAA
jgi:MSHA biogenesis protein MshI